MGALDRLPTLAEVQADRASRPNWKSSTTRLAAKTAADTDDAKLLEAWRKAVAFRDRGRCRVCGCRTMVTVALVPNRREIHHLRPRSCKVTRTDPRNGVTTCLRCHQLLTRHKLFPLGKGADATFKAGRTGKTFLNGDSLSLTFVSTRPEL